MSDNPWKRVEEIFHRAVELAPEARSAFLDEACAGDQSLRREVESLLAHDSEDGDTFAVEVSTTKGGLGEERSGDHLFRANLRFHVVRRVGAGGMGVVYEAWDEERNTRAALKTLTGFHPDALYRFKNEFRSLADVSHPNLVALYELFSEHGQWFFSMEYVEGVHFLEFVRPAWPPAPAYGKTALAPDDPTITFASEQLAEAASIDAAPRATAGDCDWDRLRSGLGQLTHAILALHAAGILHRDLKPANVKVTPEGRVVVLDFGLAAHHAHLRFEEVTAQEGLVGTVAYMAPEMARRERIADAADWYAVGVMLFEALTGRRPFEGAAARVLADKRRYEAPPAENFAANIPDDLNAICAGLLACDPARRMTGKQVLALLRWDGAATARAPAAKQPTGEGVFVGREPQLAILRAAFAVTENGAPCAAFVHGKSGIGKSALVARFLESLNFRRDVVILAGRCYEQESLPYKALDTAVDSLSRYLARLPRHEAAELMPRDAAVLAQIFPVLRQVEAIAEAPQRAGQKFDQHELRRLAFGSLRELLARLGDRRRVVLYIDDLQWGDFDSAQLLGEILRPPDAPALLFVGTHRSEETGRSPFLEEFFRDGFAGSDLDIRDVPVAALSAEEAGKLAAGLLERSTEGSGRAEQIARESGGNPYFVQELVAAPGKVETASGTNAPETSLDAALWSRIAELPADARCVLELVAVSGRPIDEKLVCEAAGTTRDPKLFVVLRSTRMIRSSLVGERSQVEAWHDRVRETIVARLEPAARRRHHLRLGEALESSGGSDVERVAAHFEGAGESARAGRHYVVAAEGAAAALAFKHSAGLFQKALDLLRPQGEERRQLTIRLASALANAGRGVEAALQYQWAAQASAGPEAMDLERHAAYWFSVSGHVDEGLKTFRKIMARAGLTMPVSPWGKIFALRRTELILRIRGLQFRERPESAIPRAELERVDVAWDAGMGLVTIDIVNGAYFSALGLLLALRAGETTRIARSLALQAGMAPAMGSTGRRRRKALVTASEALMPVRTTPLLRGGYQLCEGTAAFFLGRFDEALSRFDAAEEIFSGECTGVARELASTQLARHWALMELGRFREMHQSGEALAREAADRGDLYLAAHIGILSAIPLLCSEGPEAALSMIGQTLAQWRNRGYHTFHAMAALMRARCYLYQGEARTALNLMRSEWPQLNKNFFLRTEDFWQWAWFTRGQCALAASMGETQPQALIQEAERAARALEHDELSWSRALPKTIRAGCAGRRGDLESAASHLCQAAEEAAEARMAMFACAVRYRLGKIAGESGCAQAAEAEAAMHLEGIRDPARFSAVFVGGFI